MATVKSLKAEVSSVSPSSKRLLWTLCCFVLFQADNVTSDFSALLLAIFLALGMAYMAASFVTFIVQERVSKVRH